jgi:hypothetical protein
MNRTMQKSGCQDSIAIFSIKAEISPLKLCYVPTPPEIWGSLGIVGDRWGSLGIVGDRWGILIIEAPKLANDNGLHYVQFL